MPWASSLLFHLRCVLRSWTSISCRCKMSLREDLQAWTREPDSWIWILVLPPFSQSMQRVSLFQVPANTNINYCQGPFSRWIEFRFESILCLTHIKYETCVGDTQWWAAPPVRVLWEVWTVCHLCSLWYPPSHCCLQVTCQVTSGHFSRKMVSTCL